MFIQILINEECNNFIIIVAYSTNNVYPRHQVVRLGNNAYVFCNIAKQGSWRFFSSNNRTQKRPKNLVYSFIHKSKWTIGCLSIVNASWDNDGTFVCYGYSALTHNKFVEASTLDVIS